MEVFDEVFDSLCVSQYNKYRDERAVLFVKMKEGFSFTKELVAKIRLAIENELTKRHIPEVILETKEIPVSSKFLRLKIYNTVSSNF